MRDFNLSAVIENLEKQEVEEQVSALEEATEIVNVLVMKAVEALKRGPNRFLVAERLSNFGVAVVPHLEKLLGECSDRETRILAAMVLLKFGSKVGVSDLMDAVVSDHQYACLAVGHLANARISEAIEPILKRLQLEALDLTEMPIKTVDIVVCYLDALGRLGGTLPSELHQRLESAEAWQIRTAIAQLGVT